MALSEAQIKEISLQVKLGKLSNVKISKKVGCSESAVRTTIRKYNLKKNEINEVATKEVANTIIANEIEVIKNHFNEDEKRAYTTILDTKKKTIDIAEGFQYHIQQRQEMDNETIYALKKMKQHELSEAETVEDILKINFKYREYMSIVTDYKDIKDGIEANDKAMITKGEAPRFAPKSDTTVNNLTLVDSDKTFKGKF